MSALFDDLCQGLQEAIEYEQGNGMAKVTVVRSYEFSPVKHFTNSEIKKIRQQVNMTQTVFADYFGVSKKTIEAWECGKTHPTGPACRLLDLLAAGKAEELSFVKAV
ncbi:MAG: helix-turn-helix domain-containing protein [Selenomonadaceae bacterium]|nr:helix-turn-helix domain-containing protein [Selenomonadaceae bacterium]